MSSAAALQAAAMAALAEVDGIGAVYPGPPLQAAMPHAIVECGPEADWGHKGGDGRELRLAVTIRTAGETPERAHALAAAADASIASGISPAGWELVTLAFLRTRYVAERRGGESGWAAISEYRARLLAAED